MKEESVPTTPQSHHRRKLMGQVGSNRAAPANRDSKRKLMRKTGRLFVPAIAMIALVVTFSALAQESERNLNKVWGERYKPAGQVQPQVQAQELTTLNHGGSTLRRLIRWNSVAIDASGLDHTPVPVGDPRVFGEQLGPGRSSRAMAIVHIAIFDSINAIEGGYRSFTGIPRVHDNTSIDSAIAQAAHDTLVVLFPSQTAAFDQELVDDLGNIPGGIAKTRGIALGRRAAAAILDLKANDGSAHAEPRLGTDWFTSNLPGRWRQDPISLIPIALGAHWGEVDPFVLGRPNQFRVPPPPAMTSQAYTSDFREVKRLGGDGVVTPTIRNDDQTLAGIYWAYATWSSVTAELYDSNSARGDS